jgi:hypothetical protein
MLKKLTKREKKVKEAPVNIYFRMYVFSPCFFTAKLNNLVMVLEVKVRKKKDRKVALPETKKKPEEKEELGAENKNEKKER